MALRLSSFTHWLLQVVLATVLFLCLCVTNYSVSTWILVRCGHSLWYFLPLFTFTLFSISVFLYLISIHLSRIYIGRLIKSLEKLDLVEFSYLMSKYKEKQCSRATSESSTNLCLICYEYAAKTVTEPCGHQVMCGRCAWKYIATCIKDCQTLRCILCRTEAFEYKGDIAIQLNELNLTQFHSILQIAKMKSTKVHPVTFTSDNEIVAPCVS